MGHPGPGARPDTKSMPLNAKSPAVRDGTAGLCCWDGVRLGTGLTAPVLAAASQSTPAAMSFFCDDWLRRPNPTRPTKAEPNGHAAAGIGTALIVAE